MRPETTKILEESTGSDFSDISHNIFLDMSPEAKETKAKVNYWDYIKIKSFCTAKETIDKTKKPTEWEKIFANDISHKGLVYKYIKNLCNSTSKNLTNPCRDLFPKNICSQPASSPVYFFGESVPFHTWNYKF